MSWLDRNEVLKSVRPHGQWPRHCQFTSAEVDDIDLAELFLQKDTQYGVGDGPSQSISYIIQSDNGQLQSLDSFTLENDVDIWKSFESTAKNIIVLTHFVRWYGRKNIVKVRIPEQRWMNLVQQFALPPSALELLYDNNGGSASRFSPCSTLCMISRGNRPCAYHIWLKPSNWTNEEHFVYARHDFHTHQNIIFCAGTENESLARKLVMRLERHPNCTIFHVLHTYLSFCFYSIENGRWIVDDSILRWEAHTGPSYFMRSLTGAEELVRNELTLTKDTAWTRNHLQSYMKAASILEGIHLFTERQLQHFIEYDDSLENYDRSIPQGMVKVLSDSFSARVTQIQAQLVQMQHLKTRLETQFDTITTLISQRDSQVNIGIARSVRADAELMKGIAFVTMVFLPATFFATFFSMTFFQISPSNSSAGGSESSGFSVNGYIWMYFACTAPLTIFLAWTYGLKDMIVGNRRREQAK